MSSIIEFFSSIIDAISAAISYLFNTVTDLLYILRNLVTIRGTVLSLFSWLPLSCAAVLGIILSLAIIFRLIGRD